jgi:transposase
MSSNRTIVRAFKYRLHPTAEQAERMQNWFGATRFVYNLVREQREMAYDHWLGQDREEARWPLRHSLKYRDAAADV